MIAAEETMTGAAPRSSAVIAAAAAPASRGARTGRPPARSESAQAVVEFALVAPLIAAIVLILVDFGKAMNYWLDLTAVANEGARLAAVNGPATDEALRARLKSWELRAGNPDSGADAAAITICLESGTGEIGDSLTVEIASDYKWFSFPEWIPIAPRTDWTIKGRATMRLEQPTDAFGPCA